MFLRILVTNSRGFSKNSDRFETNFIFYHLEKLFENIPQKFYLEILEFPKSGLIFPQIYLFELKKASSFLVRIFFQENSWPEGEIILFNKISS